MGQPRDGSEGNAAYAFQPSFDNQTIHDPLLMTLVAEGKVSLREPANKYLLKNKIEGTHGDTDGATVQRLGAHVSGLPTMFEEYFRHDATLAPGIPSPTTRRRRRHQGSFTRALTTSCGLRCST